MLVNYSCHVLKKIVNIVNIVNIVLMSFCGEILFPVSFSLQSDDLHARYLFV